MVNKNFGIAWIIALIAVLGSLYFSEIAGFVPCQLCWYQRILMYPLAVIIGIGLYLDDPKLSWYVLPFSVIGVFVSSYHYLYQKTDWFSEIGSCTKGVSCSGEYINWLGFITIPLLSFTAFMLITIVMISTLKKEK
ncbi:disulfide oxidoreductase [Pseudalkalibacillus berkeleyi]|uniref:Disulfide oxidoreductase n=1 Tax=Pseudalkalibacillus berkeleyi TaxID=1069813 RepID=A0ABS9GXH1_9BACL|nr:disulfide oxidoreductase [Pseudalkalibacillus berkeleyi]MCF6136319.1 disulfide oxidoreductase [Pseudalkalibacillus berkeleyi]